MNTKTLLSIKHFTLSALFTIGLLLIANVSILLAQTDINDAEYANTTLVPAPLKICNVAGSGVVVGTPFTYTITTALEGTTGVFTSTRTILAGPASTGGVGEQSGNCDFVAGPFIDLNGVRGGALINGNGSFNVGSVVTIQQTGVFNIITETITSPTSPLSTSPATRAATLTIINRVNEVIFVNRSIANEWIPGPVPDPKPRKRIRFF